MNRNLQAEAITNNGLAVRSSGLAFFVLLAFAFLLVCCGCEDRLPSIYDPDGIDKDSLSDNSFILDGHDFRRTVFNMSRNSARAYYFAEDSIMSILNADEVRLEDGLPVSVVVHINVPGMESGSYRWSDAILDPAARSKSRISIGGEEYVSIRGSTELFIFNDGLVRKVVGTYSGIIENSSGKQIILSDGRFNGAFF